MLVSGLNRSTSEIGMVIWICTSFTAIGVNCINPLASSGLTAVGLKLLSVHIIASISALVINIRYHLVNLVAGYVVAVNVALLISVFLDAGQEFLNFTLGCVVTDCCLQLFKCFWVQLDGHVICP